MNFQPGKRLTCEERLHTFTPVLCRLLAIGRRGRPLTVDEIAARSGLPPERVDYLSHGTSWTNVPVNEMLAFTRACGCGFCSGPTRRVDEYLRAMSQDKRNAFEYLSKSPDYGEFYRPLLVKWRKSYPADVPESVWPPVRRLLERLTPLLK